MEDKYIHDCAYDNTHCTACGQMKCVCGDDPRDDINTECITCSKELIDSAFFCSDACEQKFEAYMEKQGSGPSSVDFDEEDDIP